MRKQKHKIIQVVLISSQEPLWSRVLSPGVEERKGDQFITWEVLHICWLFWKWRLPQKKWRDFWNWKQSPSHRQRGFGDLKPTVSRNLILPSTWMNLEADSSLELLGKSLAQPTPWFQPCKMLIREPRGIHWHFWPRELYGINGCCFNLINLW